MEVLADSTDVTTYVALSLLADGADATGLTITDIDLQYVRSGVAPSAKVDATALAATDSAHGDNQAIEIDATDAPGLYRVDWPDAAFATGVREVILTVKCADVKTAHLRVAIVAAGGTAPTAEEIRIEIDSNSTQLAAIVADTNELQADWANGGRLDLLIDGIKAKTDSLTFTVANVVDANALRVGGTVQTGGDIIAVLGTPVGADLSADIAAIGTSTDILDVAYEGAETIQDYLRLSRAVLYGKATGLATATPSFWDLTGAVRRVESSGLPSVRTISNLDASDV